MGASANERRLAAIMVADVVGYSRMIAADETGTLARLSVLRTAVVDPSVQEHGGRIFKSTGDGLLAEFPSAVQALRCAIAVQERLCGSSSDLQLRIGLHSADVVVQDGDLLGDGVNVAARLEPLAEPGGICISGRVREDAAGKLALEVEDLGEPELKNIAQRHRVFRVRLGVPERPTLALPDKPSLAVLPFQNMSGDPEQEYFADGMVEEIITALSRIRWLFVIARNSTFTYKGAAIDIKQVGRDLNVRYVLEGSVRRSGDRVRITAQLIDAASGAHLWADRFDGSLQDVFDLQDEVAMRVAGVIEPALQAAEISRSVARPTNDPTAYDLYLAAYAMLWRSAQVPEALRLLEAAIARDPNYGPALAWAAICCNRLMEDDREADVSALRRKGIGFARRALEVAADDPMTLANAAESLEVFGEDNGAMAALADRALDLNPNYARGWHSSGVIRLRGGQPDLAIERFEMALRLSPRAPVGSTHFAIGLAHLVSRRFEEAEPKLLLYCCRRRPARQLQHERHRR